MDKEEILNDVMKLIEYIDFLHAKDPLGYNIFIDKIHTYNKIKEKYKK